MPRHLFTALVVLLVALAAGLLWKLADAGVGAVPVGPVPGATAPPVAAEMRASDEPQAPAADAVPEGLFRTETEAEAVAQVTTLVLQVWDRAEGVPAVRADVFVLDDLENERVDWSVLKGPFAEHWGAVAERLGRRFRTGDDGRVEVAGVQGAVAVAAQQPGVYAFRWIGEQRAPDQVETLTLESDQSVTVRVVDPQGRPVAGAAVGILERVPVQGGFEELAARMRDLEKAMREIQAWMEANPAQAELAAEKMAGARREYGRLRRDAGAAKQQRQAAQVAVRQLPPAERVEVRVRRRTDANGFAEIEHLQLYRRGAGKGDASKGDAGGKGRGKGKGTQGQPAALQYQAALLMPLQQPVTHAFAAAAPPQDVIELRMPPAGSIALRTVDRDGRPFTHPVHGELRMASEDPAAWSRVTLRKEQNQRTIEFPHVGLGLVFEAACRLDDEDFRWRSPGLRGPAAPGERVEVDLVVAPDAGMLYARLLDGDAVPLAGLAPTFLINAAGGRLEGEQVTTDDQGRFHLPYQVRPEHAAPYRFEIRRDDVDPTAGLARPLAALPRARVTDLGDLTLQAFAAVARGVVVDDAGAPVAGADVQLQRQRPAGKDGALAFVDEAFVRTETDTEGRFALFGALEPASYRLRAQAKDHFPAEALLRVAGQDQRLALLRKCRVVGTVLAPDWMNRKSVRVELVPVSVPGTDPGEVQPRDDGIRDYQGRTYAYFDWVRPGTYDLAFRLQGYPEPFLRVDGLRVEPGQTGLHPRLRDLDLGAYVFRFEIHPVDQNGQPVDVNRPQLTRVTRPGGAQQWVGLVMKGRYGEVFSTTPRLEVFPMCEGYTAPPQVLTPGRSEVVYRAIPPVDLVLGGLAAMAGGVPVQVVLERLELDGLPQQLDAFDGMSKRIAGWYARARYSAAMLDVRDTARVAVTGDGPHKVILRLGVGRTRPVTVELDAVQVDVTPGGQPTRIAVPFDAQVVQQAIADTAQRMQEQGRE